MQNIIMSEKIFNDVQIGDPIYIVDGSGYLDIKTISNVVFSINDGFAKITLDDNCIIYPEVSSTEHYANQCMIFCNKSSAEIHLSGIKNWAQNLLDVSNQSLQQLKSYEN